MKLKKFLYFNFFPDSAYAAIAVIKTHTIVPTTVIPMVNIYARPIRSFANKVFHASSDSLDGNNLYPSLVNVTSSAKLLINTCKNGYRHKRAIPAAMAYKIM